MAIPIDSPWSFLLSNMTCGNVCKNTSPNSPPAARACPMVSIGESDAKFGKSSSSTFGKREIIVVQTNAAVTLVDSIGYLQLYCLTF
mmetsp:Transcript_2762/g.3262  ORF Transcript_2762/g.3262 Transcript_2762/m.3262 type:complete len:87 (-) Transcript_2762:109-369(-)